MKFSLPTAIVLILSVIAAGLLGQFRDTAIEDFQKGAELGKHLDLDNGQTITALDLSFGQFAVMPNGSQSVMSPARLVSIRFEFATPQEDEMVGMRCFLRVHGDNIVESVEEDNLRFPEPGFRSTGTVIFEITRDNLVGAQLACVPTGVIVYREPEMLMSLGVTSRNVEQIWANSAYKRVNWLGDTLEVIR